MQDNPIAILTCALQTARPELITLFEAAANRTIEQNADSAAEIATALTAAVKTLFAEVYDLRRANDAMDLSARHIADCMRGVEMHIETHKQIHLRARTGQLPVEPCMEELEKMVRESVKYHEREESRRNC